MITRHAAEQIQLYSSFFLFVTYSIMQDLISSEMQISSGPLNGQCKICNTTQENIYIYIIYTYISKKYK